MDSPLEGKNLLIGEKTRFFPNEMGGKNEKQKVATPEESTVGLQWLEH